MNVSNTRPDITRWAKSAQISRTILVFIGIICLGFPAMAQSPVPVVTGNAHVDKLLSEMTLDEKMALIRGAYEPAATNQGQAGYLKGVPRLGIPPLRMADGPPGVLTRLPSQAETATMGVAATFSRQDAEHVWRRPTADWRNRC